jgi:hypothetical protein
MHDLIETRNTGDCLDSRKDTSLSFDLLTFDQTIFHLLSTSPVISLLLHCSFIKTETAPGVAGGYDLQLQRGVNRVLALGAEPGSVAREGVFVHRGKKTGGGGEHKQYPPTR